MRRSARAATAVVVTSALGLVVAGTSTPGATPTVLAAGGHILLADHDDGSGVDSGSSGSGSSGSGSTSGGGAVTDLGGELSGSGSSKSDSGSSKSSGSGSPDSGSTKSSGVVPKVLDGVSRAGSTASSGSASSGARDSGSGTVRLPAVEVPKVAAASTPAPQAPAASVPALPSVKLPAVSVPPVQISLPPVQGPPVALPSVALPSVALPSVALPVAPLPVLTPTNPLTASAPLIAPADVLAGRIQAPALPAALPLFGPPTGDQGVLRVAHLSPSTGAVDMYVSGPGLPLTRVASDVTYRTLSTYLAATPGVYTLEARPAGAAPSTPPALTAAVAVGPRSAQTAAFVDVGPNSTPQAEVLDDGTALAPAGKAYVRVVSAAAGVGPLDVVARGGGSLAQGLFYGSGSSYAEVDAKTWTMDVRTANGESAVATVPVASTSVATVVVGRDAKGALAVTAVADAASAFPATPAPAPGTPAAPSAPAAPPSIPAAASSAPATPRPGPTPRSGKQPRGGVPAGFGGMADVESRLAPVQVHAAQAAPAEATPASPLVALAIRAPAPAPLAPAAPIAAAHPAGLVVPAAGVDVHTVGTLGLDRAGALRAPATPHDVGWYGDGAAPGDPGTAVLVGHVDSWRGPGVFWHLRDLKPGDAIDVPRSDGTVAHFAVDAVETVDKDAFPADEVYAPTAGPSLRLITCGGQFDRAARSYEDNVVVYASPR